MPWILPHHPAVYLTHQEAAWPSRPSPRPPHQEGLSNGHAAHALRRQAAGSVLTQKCPPGEGPPEAGGAAGGGRGRQPPHLSPAPSARSQHGNNRDQEGEAIRKAVRSGGRWGQTDSEAFEPLWPQLSSWGETELESGRTSEPEGKE